MALWLHYIDLDVCINVLLIHSISKTAVGNAENRERVEKLALILSIRVSMFPCVVGVVCTEKEALVEGSKNAVCVFQFLIIECIDWRTPTHNPYTND